MLCLTHQLNAGLPHLYSSLWLFVYLDWKQAPCNKPNILHHRSPCTCISLKMALEENSPFLLHFLMHIHVLMLCRKFELIPTKPFELWSFLLFTKNGFKTTTNFYY